MVKNVLLNITMLDRKYFFYTYDLEQSIFSDKTKKDYPSTLFALLKGEQIEDLKVKWFNNIDFDWTINEGIDLHNLYINRLKYLKENHEHLELWWSGGYDSNNILEVAIDGNISFDSIVITGIKDIFTYTSIVNQEQIKNKPHLDRYLEKFPNTKVHLIDIQKLTKFQNFERDKWMWAACSPVDYSLLTCYMDSILDHRKHYKTLSIYGSGEYKPMYNRKYNIWSFYKTGAEINNPIGHFTTLATNCCFYDDPRIIRQQVHTIKNIMSINKGDNLETIKQKMTVNGVEEFYSDDDNNIIHPTHDFRRKHVYKNSLPTFHIGNDEEYSNNLEHPKKNWYYKNERLPIFKEYWKWCDWINNNVPKKHFKDSRGYEWGYLNEDSITKIIDITV
jgi:hypothetical protein